jgi:hypothetical protein
VIWPLELATRVCWNEALEGNDHRRVAATTATSAVYAAQDRGSHGRVGQAPCTEAITDSSAGHEATAPG